MSRERELLKTWSKKGLIGYVLALRANEADMVAEIERHHADFQRWEEMAARGAGRLKQVAALIEVCEDAAATLDAYQPNAARVLRKRLAVAIGEAS